MGRKTIETPDASYEYSLFANLTKVSLLKSVKSGQNNVKNTGSNEVSPKFKKIHCIAEYSSLYLIYYYNLCRENQL